MKEKAAIVKIVLVAIVLCTLSATAGIKYWDNQAFKAYDVGDYVQDGLVLNYDGIRNAGPSADHDPDATSWVNCKTPGTYDMTRYSLVNSEWVADGSKGTWTSNGFVFGKDAVFHEMTSLTIPTTYTIQTLADATPGDQGGVAYVMCDYSANNWAACSFALRTASGGGTPANSVYLVSSTRPYFTTASSTTPFTYATAIHNNVAGVVFAGITAPWNATDGSYRSDLTPGPYTRSNGISLGGHYPTYNELLKGTLKNFRFYSKCLSDEEVAWNRVVDEARYFGRRVALPVTNVVISSNIPIVTGDEPIGCYAVDAGGYTFSAPASKVIKGRNYTLDGFTVETWDGSAWSAVVPHAGETSYAATDAALVRLTWQWTAGDGLVQYDADDYVQYGLVLNYDGIRNAGLGVPHDSAATTWANLGNGGSAYDMTRYYTNSSVSAWTVGTAQGSWTDKGFTFDKNSVFNESEPLLIPTKRTMQVLVDAKASSQGGIGDVVGCYNGTKWDYFSICMRSNGSIANSFYIPVFGAGNVGTSARPAIYNDSATYDYGTAIVDGNDAVWFSGTTAPWTATDTGGTTGHLKKGSLTMTEWTDSGISLGGRYPSTEQRFTGTIKSFRFYDRCLSDAEVAWNRVVDDWRYSDSAVVNVVVASTRADVQANEADGEYQVSGSYTFTAPASVTVGNITYEPAGYAIQSWDDAVGVWGAATEYTGAFYAYTTAAGKVRLLWRWKAVSGIRAAADYDVSDYVAGGLTFHLDGIRNVGADVGHAEAPETWVNLGTAGAAANTTIRGADAERVVNWTDKGYYFDGNTRFFATIPYTTTFTLQLCTDAIQNDQHNPDSSHMYPFTTDNNGFAVSTYDTRLYFRTQGNGAEYALGFGIDKTRPIGYVTAMLDDATKTARVFSGTTSSAGGSKTYDSMSETKYTNLTLGGGGSGASQFWTGTINYFRYYDRVLSDAELALNREVDQARYFGALSVTNVFVEACGGTQAETGAYKVEGEWTFTATTTVNKRGETVPVERYSIEILENSAWTNKRTYSGTSYTYTEGTSPAPVRLKWLGRAEGFVLLMR